MSTVTLRSTLGDIAAREGYLRAEQFGPWKATLEIHAQTDTLPDERSAASLVFLREDGTEDVWVGSIRRRRLDAGQRALFVSLVGGRGGLRTILDPVDAVSGEAPLPAGMILAKIATAAGEELAAGVEDALDAFPLPRWHRAKGVSAAQAIDLLIHDLRAATGMDLAWRIGPDGKIWAGVETWPNGSEQRHIGEDPDDGVTTYAPDGAPWQPGRTLGGERAVEVFYRFGGGLRVDVRGAVPGDPVAVPDLDLYRATYAAKVVKQNANGSINVRCDDARMGELRDVAVRFATPGAASDIPTGARVRIAFEGGSPRGAYAAGFDHDATADKALALVSDSCGYLTAICAAPGSPAVLAISPTPVPNSVQIVILGPGHAYAKGKQA